VLGFLSVSTSESFPYPVTCAMCFNPVLGFLSVSTTLETQFFSIIRGFQSRAGFSECLDCILVVASRLCDAFQSRAGFSECLDRVEDEYDDRLVGFNPVLGFLSVSTHEDS